MQHVGVAVSDGRRFPAALEPLGGSRECLGAGGHPNGNRRVARALTGAGWA